MLASVASDFFAFFPDLPFAAREPPIVTILASMLPSSCFQKVPLTISFVVMSANVAAAPAFFTVVLSVTLKTRELFLPAIVNVFASESTEATEPRNCTARELFAAGEAASVVSSGEALGDGDASFFGAANPVSGLAKARAATQAPVIRVSFFIGIE